MLRRFNVRNFMSFSSRADGRTEEFSMIPGKVRNGKEFLYDDGNIKLLKFAAIYGANASGKSNLVKAMHCMRSIVTHNSTKGYTEKYCRIDEENRSNPSYFEAEIVLDGKCYAYGFETILSDSKFISEWLIELSPNGDETVIFERDIVNECVELNVNWRKNSDLMRRSLAYIEDVRADDKTLFINYMNHSKKAFYLSFPETEIIREIFFWFDKLDINFPNYPISSYSYLYDSDNMKRATEIISAFGTGISDYVVLDIPIQTLYQKLSPKRYSRLKDDIDQNMLRAQEDPTVEAINISIRLQDEFYIISVKKDTEPTCSMIKFYHAQKETLFGFGEESDGTQRLWDLVEILLTNEKKVYVIDEMDRCLHPSLTYKFVETFLNFVQNKDIQLIVTTHESRLLDFNLLRRDEIWFTNKRSTGETDIYSLEEYNTRFDQKVDKAYLEGRYGGVPLFTSIFPIEEE